MNYRALMDRSNARLSAIPGATFIHQQYGGYPMTGWSGIIPFIRTRDGRVTAPLPPRSVGIEKYFPKLT